MDTPDNIGSSGVSLPDTNGSGSESNPPMKEEISSAPEKLETFGCAIEEGVEKISLSGGDGDGGGSSEICAAKIEENARNHVEIEDEGKGHTEGEGEGESESESESESSEPESATASYSSASSSDESSSDSDSDDDEEEEEKEEGYDGDDANKMVDDDEDDAGKGPIKSKNELEDLPPVPPVDVTLEPHHQMRPVGVVMSVLGAKVIVEGVEKHDPLSEGSILWITESRKPLGIVDEIFGPVRSPYYVVRYNSENEVPTGIPGGTLISFVPEFANHVLNNKDLYKKGYDASGANDEELSDEIEFSDDEKEAEYRRMQRMAKRGTNDQNPGTNKNNKKKTSAYKRSAPTIHNKALALPTNPGAPAGPTIPNKAPALPTNPGAPAPPPPLGQGAFQGTNAFSQFPVPPPNAGSNFTTNAVWTNATMPPPQMQSPQPPNAFPANGIPWYPQNTQFANQMLPLPGVPFQQQLNPNQGAMLPGVQANILAQAIIAQGLLGQNQMAFGLNQPFPQIQPQQGFPSSEMQQPERNLNLNPSTVPGAATPPQFHPGASASSIGRQTFDGAGRGRGRGRRGWRPAK